MQYFIKIEKIKFVFKINQIIKIKYTFIINLNNIKVKIF